MIVQRRDTHTHTHCTKDPMEEENEGKHRATAIEKREGVMTRTH